jgi:hypothetical protein
VKLYVCYGTFGPADRHPCAKAHRALAAAGHEFDVVRTYGCYGTDRLFKGRRQIKQLTGNYKVPTLVLDDGRDHRRLCHDRAVGAGQSRGGTSLSEQRLARDHSERAIVLHT